MGQKLNPKADEEETNRSLPAVNSPANLTGASQENLNHEMEPGLESKERNQNSTESLEEDDDDIPDI